MAWLAFVIAKISLIFGISFSNYRKDSVVTERINYDLLKKAKEIQDGVRSCEELLGRCTVSKTKDSIPTAIEKHLSKNCWNKSQCRWHTQAKRWKKFVQCVQC